MEPTLESNNILLTEHISPRLQTLRRGDIVIARSPTNPKQNICKRIVGLPGDSIKSHFPRRAKIVPRGHVWLEGDNSGNSADSRVYGPVPQGLIRSRVVCRVWPLDKITSLTEY
ncbi:mitochondrial inner membrane protease subunit 1 isoform X2 [Pectinophora gossypiella]|nr:mitochondrial inner membrane protease subunit 1 isoform X2 [Pectinophora gossypiella]